jgi:hypothetical protein
MVHPVKNTIKLLGPLLAAGEELITVEGKHGGSKAIPVAEAVGAMVVAAEGPDRERVLASVAHLAGQGSAQAALAAHWPALPAKAIAMALTIVNWATESVGDDGKISAQEYLALLPLLAQEAANE